MLILPTSIMALLEPFRPVFHLSTWNKVQILLVGAILAPGKRTVTSALRAVGLAKEPGFSKYHQVLNRAVWSSRRASQVLLTLLLEVLAQGCGPLVFGIDETIERRWGAKIQARAIYRDAVRSSHSHFVKTNGLRLDAALYEPAPPYGGKGRPRKKGNRLPTLATLL